MLEGERYNAEVHKVLLVSGMQWGDEGKGKAVTNFSNDFEIIAKFNGKLLWFLLRYVY